MKVFELLVLQFQYILHPNNPFCPQGFIGADARQNALCSINMICCPPKSIFTNVFTKQIIHYH